MCDDHSALSPRVSASSKAASSRRGSCSGGFPAPDLLDRQPPLRLEAGDVEAGAGERLAVALGLDAAVDEPAASLHAERVERRDDGRELLLAAEEHGDVGAGSAVERRGKRAGEHG